MQVRRWLVGPLGKRRVSSLVDIIIGRLVFRSVARERCLLFSLVAILNLSCRVVKLISQSSILSRGHCVQGLVNDSNNVKAYLLYFLSTCTR